MVEKLINQTVGDILLWLTKRLFAVGGVDAQKSSFKTKHYENKSLAFVGSVNGY